VIELLESVDAGELESFVPATPDWRARDVLAHMAGTCSDLVQGNLDGVGTDPWTKLQVDARHERTVEELVAEWGESGDVLEGLVDDAAVQGLLFDTVAHEHDLRHGLAHPGARDSEAMRLAFDWWRTVLVALDRPLRIETEWGTVAYTAGDASSSARTTAFDLLRATTGRRSAEEIKAWEWTGAPRPDLIVSGPPFAIRDSPLGE
jgi:hypothetical protein